MHKSKGDRGEYEFTRAAHDELKDAEKLFGVKFHVELEPTEQLGVWALCVAAVKPEGVEGMIYASTWRGTWPNTVSVSYGAFLYQACHRCVRMVEAWHNSQLEELAQKQHMG